MNKRITVIKGDGIGPEIVNEAIKIIDCIGNKYGHKFDYSFALMGGCAIDLQGTPLPKETVKLCLESDSVLLGAVGGPKWDNVEGDIRPERGLLELRKSLKLFANLRPAKLYNSLSDICPLKQEITSNEIDIMMVRELTGGVYFGEHKTIKLDNGITKSSDDMSYYDYEIERVIRVAFEIARKRRGKIHSIDKANVLDTSRLWRKIANNIKNDYNDIVYQDMLVDNCAMQLIRNPMQFDVIVTENLFGDILSDEASMIVGSLGMIPSASIGEEAFGLYEPIHGSAPDIAGKNIANPIAMILSAAMMLRYSFNMNDEADDIENAVNVVLDEGYRTADIYSSNMKKIGCSEMGSIIEQKIRTV